MTKPPSREQAILAELRGQITRGERPPGSRLPLRAELEQHFGAATQTVQRAVSQLAHDGFVRSRGRLGTFVCDCPPHLHRVGLVASGNPADPQTWDNAKFETFLYRETLAMQQRAEADLAIYLQVNQDPARPDHQRLLDDIRARRLAGLIFDVPHFAIVPPLSAALEETGLPCVMICNMLARPNVTALDLPAAELLRRALDYLRDQRRRRVGLLTTAYSEPAFHNFAQQVRERGMTTRSYWLQGVHPRTARLATNCAHLLMQAKERPDALFITDDVLVEHATAGLAEAGVHIPRDLVVVAHCNYPYVTPSRVPAKRIGFDVREVLRTALDVLQRRRQGAGAPRIVSVQPKFDDEVPAPS